MRPKLVPELICSDLQRSLAFYLGPIGFRILYSRPEDRFAYLEREGAELMLEQPHSYDRLWPKADLLQPYGRGVNFQIGVSDVDRIHTAVTDAGFACYLPIEERWYRRDELELGVRQFAVQDPDGYLIRLSQSIGNRPSTRQQDGL